MSPDFTDAATVFSNAVEAGYLIPGVDGIDWTDPNTQFNTAMAGFAQVGIDGFNSKSGDMADAATTAANSVATAMDNSGAMETTGKNSADGWTSGFLSKLAAMKAAARRAARETNSAFNATQESHSPARLWGKSGAWSGEGWEGGFTTSMQSAIKRIPHTMNNLLGAANLPFRTSFAEVTQSITSALSDTGAGDGSVGFYVNGKRLADVTVDDNRRAQNARIRRLALGVGK